ncbi:MAG: SUMF1/EgtB/PvdO family nonheme iron enzyme [Gammaproteobacteria bacterium]|nr:SUMF1/EgtB/PvdO family nonheme iron enzyme [Gammaproteobacteria bacterium]
MPDRRVGITVISFATVLVALYLFQVSTPKQQTEKTKSIAEWKDLPGFSSTHWYLPDEELLGFVEIPAGTFIMGSNPALDRMAYLNEQWSDLRRQGEVDLPRYFIARNETTKAQFARYLAESGQKEWQPTTEQNWNLPAANLSWPEALAYTRWLDQQLRKATDIPNALRIILDSDARVTLPNEAEWEKAARGTDGRIFPWSSSPIDSLANFNAEAPRLVGSKCTQCAWGLHDMAGNVWELTRSPLKNYPWSAEDDAGNLDGDALYVMRGGSYADSLNNIRAAVRGAVDPGARNETIGFRIVISNL